MQGEVSEGLVPLEVATVTVVREAVVTAIVLETSKMAVPATVVTTPVPATMVTTMEMRPAPAKSVRRAAPATIGVGVDRTEERRGENDRDHRSDGPSIHRANLLPPIGPQGHTLHLIQGPSVPPR